MYLTVHVGYINHYLQISEYESLETVNLKL